MNRTEKMNEIRSLSGLETAKRSFFYRDEFVTIVENIIGRDLSEDELSMTIREMIAEFMPQWTKQSTSNNHPSLQNVDYIISLLESKGVDDQDVPKQVVKCLAASKDRVVGLAEFVLRGINPNFGENILAVSVSEINPKEFTVTLK